MTLPQVMGSSTLSRPVYNVLEVSTVNRQDQSSKPLRAHVVLKGKAGDLTAADGPISSDNIEEYTASPNVRDQVQRELENLGFSVEYASPLSIAVEAAPQQFETVFHGRLKKKEYPDKREGVWTWASAPTIPAELSDKVDTVVLPQPTKAVSSE
jgi:hypothetical protein